MKIKEYLTKLQSLPEKQKKIILWSVVAVLALIMGFFWIRSSMDRFSKFSQEIKRAELPQIEIPDMGLPK